VKAWIEARGCGPVELKTGKSGQFDIVAGAETLYSRFETGRFPWEPDLEQIVPQLPAAPKT
jgi:predicted Rdx family selenoprotein